MTQQSQELMTPQLAAEIQEYERQLLNWQSVKTVQRRGALYACLIAAPLWAISFAASSETGIVNQANWFTAVTFFAFVAALISTIAAVVLGGVAAMNTKPVKQFKTEKTIREFEEGL